MIHMIFFVARFVLTCGSFLVTFGNCSILAWYFLRGKWFTRRCINHFEHLVQKNVFDNPARIPLEFYLRSLHYLLSSSHQRIRKFHVWPSNLASHFIPFSKPAVYNHIFLGRQKCRFLFWIEHLNSQKWHVCCCRIMDRPIFNHWTSDDRLGANLFLFSVKICLKLWKNLKCVKDPEIDKLKNLHQIKHWIHPGKLISQQWET